jgi:hypothetical protein
MKAKLKRSGIGKSSASQPKGSDVDFANFGNIKSNTYTKNPTGGPDYNGTQGVPSIKKGDEGGRDGAGYYVEQALGWKKGDVANNRKDNTSSKSNYHAKFDNDTNAFVANTGHTEPREKTAAVKLLRLQKDSPLWPKGIDAGDQAIGTSFKFDNNAKNKSKGLTAGGSQNPVKGGGAKKHGGVNGSNSNKGMALGKSGNRGGFSAATKGATVTSYGMKKPYSKNQKLG